MFRFFSILFLSAAFCHAEETSTPIYQGISTPSSEAPEFSDNTRAIRYFPEWKTLQPSDGKWNYEEADSFVAAAQQIPSEITGLIYGPPAWLSTDSSFPLTNTSAIENYIANLISRYGKDVVRWEFLPGYNSGQRQTYTPFRYVELLTLARKTAREIQPDAAIGFSLSNFDLEFLDDALREGAGGQFDFIALSPFPYSAGAGLDPADLLIPLRRLLQSYDIDSSMPIVMTLSGKEEDIAQAASLDTKKGYLRIFLEAAPSILAKIPADAGTVPDPISYADSKSVEIIFEEKIESKGLIPVTPFTNQWDADLKASRLRVTAKPPVVYIPILAARDFISPETREIEITVTAKRLPSAEGLSNPTGVALTYESVFGSRDAGLFWAIPGGDEWQKKTWKISDAKFIGRLGWNFRLDASGAGNDVLIQKIVLSR